jgi:prophage antirepressor-like protein
MNDLQVFSNSEFNQVRALTIDGEPWFVGKDIAKALGYADTYGALRKHIDPEDKQNCQNDSFETPRGMTIINESGLYSLILSSKLPAAKKFKRWVTAEVLPTLRKTGAYTTTSATTPPAATTALSPVDYLQVARTLAVCRREQAAAVYRVLRLAGVDIPETALPAPNENKSLDDVKRRADQWKAERDARHELLDELAEKIDTAVEHGMTAGAIGLVVGFPIRLLRTTWDPPMTNGELREAVDDLDAAIFDLCQTK